MRKLRKAVVQEFTWNRQREEAASLLADGQLSDREIAAQLKCSERQLNRWKLEPAFQARQREHVDAWKQRIRDRLLCLKEGRIEALLNKYAALQVILKERGAEMGGGNDPADPRPIAGGSTGYICRDFKGKDATQPVYLFDGVLYREERATLEQIADELGQLVKRHEHTGKDGKAIEVVKRVIGVAEDEL